MDPQNGQAEALSLMPTMATTLEGKKMSETQICENCKNEIPTPKVYVLKGGKVVCWGCLQEIVEEKLDSENTNITIEAIKEIGQIILIGITRKKKYDDKWIKRCMEDFPEFVAGYNPEGAKAQRWFEKWFSRFAGSNEK